MEIEFIITISIFVIVFLTLIGIIYYMNKKQKETDDILSLLNEKINKKDIQHTNVITNLQTNIESNKDSIQDNKREFNEKIESKDNDYESKNTINENNITTNTSNINDMRTDYDEIVVDIGEFENKFIESLASLQELTNDFNLYKTQNDSNVNMFEVRVTDNYTLATSNHTNLIANRVDIDTNRESIGNIGNDIEGLNSSQERIDTEIGNIQTDMIKNKSDISGLLTDVTQNTQSIEMNTDKMISIEDEMGANKRRTDNRISTNEGNIIENRRQIDLLKSGEVSGTEYIMPDDIHSPLKFRLVNHYNSKYITHHNSIDVEDSYFYDGETYRFICKPEDYLISYRGGSKYYQDVFLFEGMYGNTQSSLIGETKYKYMQIGMDQTHEEIDIEDRNYSGNIKITYDDGKESELTLRNFKSMYVPAHVDLIFVNSDEETTKRLRDYYPTQLFINYNSLNPDEFWEFVYQIVNGTVQATFFNPNHNRLPKVTSVFLRNHYLPFSVLEFQQNETVYWSDLMLSPSLNKFYTNNGKVYSGYIIYLPEDSGIKILDVHNVDIYELKHTKKDLTSNYFEHIEPILCDDNYCLNNINPIIASNHSMTLQIEFKETVKYPYKTPVFKVI